MTTVPVDSATIFTDDGCCTCCIGLVKAGTVDSCETACWFDCVADDGVGDDVDPCPTAGCRGANPAAAGTP